MVIVELAEVIAVDKNYELKHYFPYVEMTGRASTNDSFNL